MNIDPPPRYRDTRIKGSYDDNSCVAADPGPPPTAQQTADAAERMSAADAKRARKAAKRLKETQV